MSTPMKRYRIHTYLDGFEGAKSGRIYRCTRGAIYDAPEGEFKEMKAGQPENGGEYSCLGEPGPTGQSDAARAGASPEASKETDTTTDAPSS